MFNRKVYSENKVKAISFHWILDRKFIIELFKFMAQSTNINEDKYLTNKQTDLLSTRFMKLFKCVKNISTLQRPKKPRLANARFLINFVRVHTL